MTSLSWACTSACGGGATLTPSATSLSSSSVGHVLVVERQHVGSGRDAAQVFQIGVRTDHDVGGDLRGRLIGGGGQHPQRLPQGDRGLVGHPGQLTAADHGD